MAVSLFCYTFSYSQILIDAKEERGEEMRLQITFWKKVIMDEKRNLFQQINQRLSHYDLRRQLGIGQEQRRELIL